MKNVTINKEQRLYVLKESHGYSCLGFEVAMRWANEIAAFAGIQIEQHRLGSLAAYDYYCRALNAGWEHHLLTGKRDTSELEPALTGLEGRRIECTIYGERKRFIVGKSNGWRPAHLMILTSRSPCGVAISRGTVSNVRVIA